MTTAFVDLDGTILDVRERYYRLHSDIATDLGRRPLARGAFWDLKRHGAALNTLLPDWDGPSRKEYDRRWRRSIEDPAYVRHDRLIAGAPEALAELRRFCRLVLVTLRRDAAALHRQLQHFGIHDCFEELAVAGGAGGERRNKSALLKPVRERRPGPAVIVGDTEADVQVAHELGIPVVCVLTGLRDRPFLEALHPDAIVESIGEVPPVLRKSTLVEGPVA